MNVHQFRLIHEAFAKSKLAEYLNIDENLITHESAVNPTSDFDLIFKGIKFDVKYSHPTRTEKNKEPIWDFNLRKQNNGKRTGAIRKSCDFYILIGMKNGIPIRVFVVPFSESPTNHIRISIKGDSKYNMFVIGV